MDSTGTSFDDTVWQGAAPSISWDTPPPATFEGTITAQDTGVQTDFESGEALTWADGRPRRKVIVTLSDKEGDLHSLHVRIPSNLYGAIKTAIKLQGVQGLRPGDWLSVTYTGDGEKVGRKNPPKLFDVVLGPGAGTLPDDPFSDHDIPF